MPLVAQKIEKDGINSDNLVIMQDEHGVVLTRDSDEHKSEVCSIYLSPKQAARLKEIL